MSDKSVHKILDKRLSRDGNKEFLIECKSCDKKTEEWRTSENIEDFENLIKEFDNQSNQKTTNGLTNGINGLSNGLSNGSNGLSNEMKGTIKDMKDNDRDMQLVDKTGKKLNGFDRGFHPFKILGAKSDEQNGLMFLVMFREDMTTADLIPNHILHEKCPQLLIKFYEKNTLWKRY